MVNFGPLALVPARYQNRRLLQHTDAATLMRTTPDECATVGKLIASKLNQARGPVTVMIPLQGLSGIDARGGAFEDPAADQALIDAVCGDLEPWIEVVKLDRHINDPEFGEAMAERLHRALVEPTAVDASVAAGDADRPGSP